jgi:hypothetical protein
VTPLGNWRQLLGTFKLLASDGADCCSGNAIQGKLLLLIIKTALHIHILDNTSKPLHCLIQIPDILPAATNRKPMLAGHHCARSECPKHSQQHTIFHPCARNANPLSQHTTQQTIKLALNAENF